jgi:hypothetical protein
MMARIFSRARSTKTNAIDNIVLLPLERSDPISAASDNLKLALEHLGLTNIAPAKAPDIDPSVISRYLSGKRRLMAASPQMDAIAGYILARTQRVSDVEWLKDRFRRRDCPPTSRRLPLQAEPRHVASDGR